MIYVVSHSCSSSAGGRALVFFAASVFLEESTSGRPVGAKFGALRVLASGTCWP